MKSKMTSFGDNKDYTFVDLAAEAIPQNVVALCKKLLNLGCNIENIQVLTAKNIGDCGTVTLNNMIQKVANPNYGKEVCMKIGDTTYYALYFGKSTNGRNRFGQHTRGSIKKSTLRETLRAVLSLKGETCTEEHISAELQKCYYEWMEFIEDDRELIDSFEMMAIAIGYYPLNMEGNTSISEEWKKAIMDKRKELKDYE
jgi:predicted GIY-YIG superfamily endonuclease